MIKNKDPRIKQIRESFFCRLKAQLLLNFMILKIPMGSALFPTSFFVWKGENTRVIQTGTIIFLKDKSK